MKSLVALVCVLVVSMASVGEASIFRRSNHRGHNHHHNFNYGHNRNFNHNYGHNRNFYGGYGSYGGGYSGGGSTVIVQQPATQAPVIAAPPAEQPAPVAPQPAPATDGGVAQAIKDLSKLGPVEIVITPDGRTTVRLLGGAPAAAPEEAVVPVPANPPANQSVRKNY